MGPGLDKTAIGAFNLGISRFDWFCLDKRAPRAPRLDKTAIGLDKMAIGFDKTAICL